MRPEAATRPVVTCPSTSTSTARSVPAASRPRTTKPSSLACTSAGTSGTATVCQLAPASRVSTSPRRSAMAAACHPSKAAYPTNDGASGMRPRGTGAKVSGSTAPTSARP